MTSHSEPATMAEIEQIVGALEAAANAKKRHDEQLHFLHDNLHRLSEQVIKVAECVKHNQDRLDDLIAELQADQQNIQESFDAVRGDVLGIVDRLKMLSN